VLFILESWTARHVGVLGGRSMTPFFDGLSRQGAFFDQFFANGLRTPEGMFSILSSFPNQPLRRILGRASSYLVRWRTMSEILAEVGYDTIFVHGRDLDFDRLSSFLKVSRFERIIDRHSFPPSAPAGEGHGRDDDEEVMRHAHQQFARRRDGRSWASSIQ
jgi:phosphoglycerol transferase MdoB-like AlkP superfamily enzyme